MRALLRSLRNWCLVRLASRESVVLNTEFRPGAYITASSEVPAFLYGNTFIGVAAGEQERLGPVIRLRDES